MRFGLIPRLLIGLAAGIVIGLLDIDWMIRTTETARVLLGSLIKFFIPLILIAFIAAGIAELRGKTGKLLGFTVGLSYVDTVIAAGLAALAAYLIIPSFGIEATTGTEALSIAEPFIEIEIPPIMDVMSALILAFILGIGATWGNSPTISNAVIEFREIIIRCINKLVIPILPFFIASIFTGVAAKGDLFSNMVIFSKMFALILIAQIVWLVIEYVAAGIIYKQNPWVMFKALLPAYFTAVGTMSSAVTMPVALKQAQKVKYMDKDIVDFVIPLCNTVHLSGAAMGITTGAITVSVFTTGDMPSITTMIAFVILLGVIEVGAVGVPGGSVMAALGILQSVLGFDEAALGLMITLFAIQDGFAAATNVVGDGALSMIVNQVFGKRKATNITEESDVTLDA
ncbi:cation:dicarboxylase symporter family transporter [Lentibacillus sp. N15]|uniref:cation:dicarboxylate symporter family transporter n=1 Tax=Lentibacillus songyuanensis TaxID=3136161 RepID=UPI0031B9BAA3